MKRAPVVLVLCAWLTFLTVVGAVAAPGGVAADGSDWGVLFLLTMPYAVGGSIAAWIVFSHRRAAKGLSRLRKGIPFLHLVETPKEGER